MLRYSIIKLSKIKLKSFLFYKFIYKLDNIVMEGLERMHLVHARLLYIIAEMFKEDRIDDV